MSTADPEGNANLYARLRERFPADPAATFIEDLDGRRFSYGDLEAESARLAGTFAALGLAPGDRVAVQVDK